MGRLSDQAGELAQRLGDRAEAVCRQYLSKGHREGRYWLVGDAHNTPGRSLYVRLSGSEDGRGAAGKWTDAATGEHGDLLDIIMLACGHAQLRDSLDEARHFLSLPHPEPGGDGPRHAQEPKAPTGSPQAAQRLFAASAPVRGSLVQTYLRERAITALRADDPLRFHPRCYYTPSRKDLPGTRRAWPAMIAAVTDQDGAITGVHRTWLDPAAAVKAPVATPRRAMGFLLGHGVRFGRADAVMAAGEGIETILSLRQAMPAMPMIAALCSAHLSAILFPPALRRLYVGRDDDPAGSVAVAKLTERASGAGIEVVPLSPMLGDFNEDLRLVGPERMAGALAAQLVAEDAGRFLAIAG
ncbi:MAG: toprim domain-containing protein [Proteobacteria bacterium]|nr:toprim domain-containing protein [Pseudomonadota bacterium]